MHVVDADYIDVPHIWLPNGGLQQSSGDQKLVPESRPHSELCAPRLVGLSLAIALRTLPMYHNSGSVYTMFLTNRACTAPVRSASRAVDYLLGPVTTNWQIYWRRGTPTERIILRNFHFCSGGSWNMLCRSLNMLRSEHVLWEPEPILLEPDVTKETYMPSFADN